jgi:biotin operon repressor
MEDPWRRIAALAPTLKEGELRVLLELTRNRNESNRARCSSRQLAESTGLSRKNVQLAIDSLASRGVIASDGGSATRASTYQLAYLDTAVLPGRGVIKTPPPPEQVALFQRHPGVVMTPPLASEERHPGVVMTPPPDEESVTSADRSKEHARAPGSIDFDSNVVAVFDRLAKAKPKNYDPKEFAEARSRLHNYKRKFGAEKQALAPDDDFVASFLAIASWDRLDRVLQDLALDRIVPGDTYGWFITVAIQRIYGLSPTDQRKIRADLRLVGKRRPAPAEQQSLVTPGELGGEANHPLDVQRAIADAARRKALR